MEKRGSIASDPHVYGNLLGNRIGPADQWGKDGKLCKWCKDDSLSRW